MGQVIQFQDLEAVRDQLRSSGQRIVLTNGHFDLLHIGHLRYLNAARELGDSLIVGINDDKTTTDRKGLRRPIIPEQERAELVAGLACVDFSVVFTEPTADELIRCVRPDIYVKGGDYTVSPDTYGTPLPEAETVAECGGMVHILDLEPGQSTSAIEDRIVTRWLAHGQSEW
jgi:D-glycero-beta-D-manno-heptose 1-phosphate adenylyltransferase